MAKKRKTPVLKDYINSVRNNKKDWEKYLNTTYPMPNMKIEVSADEDGIAFRIGNPIHPDNRLKLDIGNVKKIHNKIKDNFKQIAESIFDLSIISYRQNFIDPKRSEYFPVFGGYFIIPRNRELYRDFVLHTNKRTGSPNIWEGYYYSKNSKCGFLGFDGGGAKAIKDLVIKQFATDEMEKRNKAIDKLRIQEKKISKAKDTIKKAEEEKRKLLSKI